jgi:hypothetical protein
MLMHRWGSTSDFHIDSRGEHRNKHPKNDQAPYKTSTIRRRLHFLVNSLVGKTRRYCQTIDSLQSADESPHNAGPTTAIYQR